MKKYFLTAAAILICLCGCTDNQRAKNFGGTETIVIPTTEKFVNATWKEDELWYVVRKREEGEKAQTFELREKSSYGVLQGKVIFKEE